MNPFLADVQTQNIEVESAVTEQYNYELTEIECTTGEQKADTFDQICIALKDDSLNNQCAKEDREILFNNSRCKGQF
jgi:hypothetical protein